MNLPENYQTAEKVKAVDEENIFDLSDGEKKVLEISFFMERESLRYTREFTEEEEVKLS